MEVRIRPAVLDDVPQLVQLWREMWEVQAAQDARMKSNPMAEMVMKRWLEEHLGSDRSGVLVAMDGEQAIGYALGTILENPPVVPEQFYGYFSDLAVTERYRRRGVGRRLAEAMHEWFRSKSIPYVQVQVSMRNGPARDFWRNVGYGEFTEMLRREMGPWSSD